MSETAELLPATAFLRIPEEGGPFIEGVKCAACGETHLGEFAACPACADRHGLIPVRLADHGVLHSFTIVHRTFPGVETPFVSAVVALDGGGFLKGNLVGVPATPEAVRVGQPVCVRFREAPRSDAKGRRYLIYEFAAQPSQGDRK